MIVQPQPVIEYAQVVQPQIYQPGMVVPGYAQAVPQAVVGLDTNHDGRANLFVSGEDRNFDGIPDVLQQPQLQQPQYAQYVYGQAVPQAVVGLDTNHDGRANLFVSGADRNFDGIPDVLQQPQVVYGNAVPGVVQYLPGQFNAIPVQEAQAVPNGGVL